MQTGRRGFLLASWWSCSASRVQGLGFRVCLPGLPAEAVLASGPQVPAASSVNGDSNVCA